MNGLRTYTMRGSWPVAARNFSETALLCDCVKGSCDEASFWVQASLTGEDPRSGEAAGTHAKV